MKKGHGQQKWEGMKDKNKALKIASGMLIFILILSQTMRIYMVTIAIQHNRLHLVGDVIALADVLLAFCIGMGLLVIGLFLYEKKHR